MTLIDDLEEEDLPFMDPGERARALGLGSKALQARDVGPIPEKPRGTQPPPPGKIVIRVAQVARERQIVNKHGPYAGQVSASGIQRATGLAATTIHRFLHEPENLSMMDLPTLARLCGGLRCTPGELLHYEPNSRRG